MKEASFFCKVPAAVKDKFDIALIKRKGEGFNREQVVEKLLLSYAKNGLPEN